MTLDEHDLVARARGAGLSDGEIDVLVQLLASDPAAPSTYTRLNALGWTMRADLVGVVAPFLSRDDDPMLAGLALQILVGRWALGRRFAERVLEFAAGVAWDADDDVRHIALSTAGELAREDVRKTDMLAALLRALDDRERAIVRDAAYGGLLRAVGRDWGEVPGVGGAVGPSEDPAVVALAQKLATRSA